MSERLKIVPEERYHSPRLEALGAELPGAPPQPWIEKRSGVPAGAVTQHRFRSRILDNERDVFVYTPPGYHAGGGTYGLIVLFDGTTYRTGIPAPTVLDNLIAAGKMAPAVAVLIDYAQPEDRGRELACNPQFASFLKTELMPWVDQREERGWMARQYIDAPRLPLRAAAISSRKQIKRASEEALTGRVEAIRDKRSARGCPNSARR